MNGYQTGTGAGTQGLPTAEQVLRHAENELDRAYRALSDAADWLRSDWTPLGSALTRSQADRRNQMRTQIAAAKNAINHAKREGQR